MSVVADHIRTQLPDIGETLATQLIDLSVDATIERCDAVIRTLGGTQATLMQLRLALGKEATHGAAP